MATEQPVTHKLVERLSTWRGTALFHARDGRSLRGLVVRLFENDPQRARDVVLAAMHRAITISHPVIDLALPETDRGSLVMVSDIWPGELLDRRLLAGPLPLGLALDIARNLAAGLAALHRTGLAHGGVHPANIWLAEDGAVRLLGLGLAAADERPLAELAASEVAYLAPEVLRGDGDGARADIWSLGAVLRQCLTGRSVYSGQRTTQVIRHILDAPLSPLAGQVPESIERFLEETLRTRPEDRLADGDAAHRALLDIPDFLPIDPTRPLDISDESGGLPEPVLGPVSEGTRIHGYQILDTLGRGGMGVVYRARDLRLERDVALKFLPLHVDEEQREHFEREARAASSLDHPNICTIFGIDETADGDTYIAMACYDGPNLGERLVAGPLELEEAIRIGEQIASGLEAAHRIGLVHRDIKPGNILFSRDGTVKIVDFGLSAIAEPGSGVIETEELYGTMGYVAPEILSHQPFDARVDIWALGVVLYEMVSGRRPFEGRERLYLLEVLEADPSPLGKIAPGVPKELERIVDQALARDPAARTQSAGEVAAALRRLRLGEEPAEKRDGRNLPLVATLVVLLVLASAALFLRSGPPATQQSSVVFAGIDVPGERGGDAGAMAIPAWSGLALEELLGLELAARSRPHRRPSDSQAQRALASYEPSGGFTAAALRDSLREGETLLGGRIARTEATEAAGEAPDGGFTVHLTLQGGEESRNVSVEASPADLPQAAAELAQALFGEPLDMGETATGKLAGGEAVGRASIDLAAIESGGHLEPVQRALAQLDAPKALALLGESGEKEVSETPSVMQRLLLASSLYELGRENEAQSALDGVDLHALPAPWPIYLRARQLDMRRDYPRAAALYHVLLRGDSLDQLPATAPFEAASALIRGGEPQLGLELLDGLGDDARGDLLRADAYHWSGNYERQLQAAERAAEKAERDDLPFIAARAERIRSVALLRSGDLDGGLAAVRRAAELYRALDHVKGQADAAMSQGILHYERGEMVLAKDSYDRASRLYASLGNLRAEARTLTNKALVLEQQGDLGAHIEVTERALDLFRQREDQLAELMTLVNSAMPLAQRGRLEDAEAAFRRAGGLAGKAGRFEPWVSASHGGFLLTMGELAQARAKLDFAKREQQLTGDEIGLAVTRATEARLALAEGELQQAHELYEEALPVLERGSPGHLSIALRGRAELALAESDLEAASAALERAAELSSPRLEKFHVCLAQAEVALAGGEPEAARRIALEALAEFQLRRADLPAARALTTLARIALEDGDEELALLRLQELAEKTQSDSTIALPRPLEQEIRLVHLRARLLAQGASDDMRPELQALLAEVLADGSIPLELEVRLALGEAELRAGYEAAARERLADLASEASLKGFRALAERARRIRNDYNQD